MNMRVYCREQLEWSVRAKGTVLIVTIWVVLVLAGLALVFARSMRVAAIVTANHIASLHAECAADGGMQYIMAQLLLDEQSTVLDGSTPYEAMQVGQGYFWVLRSNLEEDRAFDYGLTDEAGRINLNSASLEMLLKLPGMTAELAASIIDWRDENSELSPGGAENEYYLLLSEPYNCKNSAFETVEEVLLVKGASKYLLYGEDTNLNGILDDNENDAGNSEPPDNSNGRLEGGFYDYVTVYSAEANVDSSGNERININKRRADELGNLLREAISGDRYFDVMDRIRSGRPFENILDFYYKTELTMKEFEPIVDRLTTSDEEELPGLVNVNTAPKEVLLCLPGLEESDAEALLSHRGDGENLESIAWVTEVLDEEKAVAIGGHITTRSFQYSADIVGVAANGRAYKRYRVAIDIREDTPRVVYWKSLTDMGWPLERDIVISLRSGEASAVLGMK
jgi:DNA uptake protein ComE-like DNA-binding protein